MITDAVFSECGKYRYSLRRIWDVDKKVIVFCMLNPSTADEIKNDPTIERCQRRSVLMGMGGLVVVNAFAYRSTDPKELYKVEDPVGPKNSEYIFNAAKNSGIVICGWGKHGVLHGRDQYVLSVIKSANAIPLALRINKDGSPAHPLYIRYDQKPVNLITGKEFQ